MNEVTATNRQNTPNVEVEKFHVRYQDEDGFSVHFESTPDLAGFIQNTVTDTANVDSDESQVLVRINVDGEPLHIVYVDSTQDMSDVEALDAAIAHLRTAREQLVALVSAS